MAAKKQKKETIEPPSELNENQKTFCREYIFDWNASRAYRVAYPGNQTEDAIKANACRMLTNDYIKAYIEEIQKDLEKQAGISRLRVIKEHEKLAFSSIAHLHNKWIELKDFELLSKDQKDCIAEIDTKIKTEYQYNKETEKKEPISVEYIRIKLYDKQKSLDSITKMLGYNAPEKTELTGKDGKDLIPTIKGITFETP